jgi:riboflavin kinase/FMN adenylyltransferase
MTNADRLLWLAASGADYLLALPFTDAFAQTEPTSFLDTIFSTVFEPRGVHIGYDFKFGNQATGNVAALQEWGERHRCAIHAHPLLFNDARPVTATRIREALEAGKLAEANELLTRPFYQPARVTPGRQVGRELGFPTANLVLDPRLVTVGDGVYAGYVFVDDVAYKAAISVGVPATFAGVSSTIEAHLLDFDGDLYGREVRVAFVEYLRPMRSFDTAEDLKRTVDDNIAWVREHL